MESRGSSSSFLTTLGLIFITSLVLIWRNLSQINSIISQEEAFAHSMLPEVFSSPLVGAANDNSKQKQQQQQQPSTKITIAYAVTVTSCKKKQLVMDGASVLQHSIHLATTSKTNNTKGADGSNYDYQMVAFVHPDGVDCIGILKTLNYTVHIKSVPFALDHIRGGYKAWANRTGCCGEKEWLKLYAYTLTQFPVVVHLDLDCLILKPLDDLFDVMITNTSASHEHKARAAAARERIPAMWTHGRDMPDRIDAFFTRDYGMIQIPGRRKPHQIGVQGGFLVIRPSQAVFDEYIDIILEGNYTERNGWGDTLGYGGYYGAGTIQGLAAMYYSHLRPKSAVELNRCIYNNMVDSPYPRKYDEKPEFQNMTERPCITLEETCDDCRKTNIADIVTIHLTNCQKPWNCAAKTPNFPPLCTQHHYEWFRVRHSLEAYWGNVFGGSHTVPPRIKDPQLLDIQKLSLGFCTKGGPNGYRPISQDLL